MNIKELKEFLPYAFKIKASVMVHGLHGIGKSQSIKQYAEENELQFIDRRLSQMESGDLLGLPDLKDGLTTFATPAWLPRDPKSKGVLFLDEINRARPDVLQAVFQLVLDRQIGDYRLPEGWQVVSAVNPNTDDYDVTNVFDEALMDRFLHVKLTPTVQEYIQYMQSNKKLDQTYVSFLQAREELIENTKLGTFSLDRKPSRRSNEKAAELAGMLPDHLMIEGLGGLVGITTAVAYNAWVKENQIKPLTAKEIFGNYEKIAERVAKYTDPNCGRSDIITASLDNVYNDFCEKKSKIKDKEMDAALVFIQKIPKDLAEAFLKRLTNSDVLEVSKKATEYALESDLTNWLVDYEPAEGPEVIETKETAITTEDL